MKLSENENERIKSYPNQGKFCNRKRFSSDVLLGKYCLVSCQPSGQ